ncbi:hypothetical protein STEG23_000800, partial [Scotinomys teguina]
IDGLLKGAKKEFVLDSYVILLWFVRPKWKSLGEKLDFSNTGSDIWTNRHNSTTLKEAVTEL